MSDGATDPTPAYRVDDGDPVRDRATVLATWRGSLGDETRMAAKFDWFYRACPHGDPMLKLLRQDAMAGAAGTCALGRRPMFRDGQAITAGLLVDFTVARGHRSLGPGLMLQRSLLATAQREMDLVYGFPNRRAVPIFKRLGWRPLVDMVRYSRVLRHGAYLRRRMPAVLAAVAGRLVDTAQLTLDGWRAFASPVRRTSWADQVDPRMDALWSSAPKSDALLGVRHAEALRWRFDTCPLAKTRFLLVCDRRNVLLAWFATRVDRGILHLDDAWSIDGDRGVARDDVLAMVRTARAQGHAAISMQLGTDPTRTRGWLAAGFLERERRPVYGMRSDGFDPDRLVPYLTAADEDE